LEQSNEGYESDDDDDEADADEQSEDESEDGAEEEGSNDEDNDDNDQEALQVAGMANGGAMGDEDEGDNSEHTDEDSEDDNESVTESIAMDDDQMLALDEKLASIFKERRTGKKSNNAGKCDPNVKHDADSEPSLPTQSRPYTSSKGSLILWKSICASNRPILWSSHSSLYSSPFRKAVRLQKNLWLRWRRRFCCDGLTRLMRCP
jgi:hypothetical protein